MDKEERKLKCRFCGWQISLYAQIGDELEDNWPALKNHVARRHPDEFHVIQRSLVDVRAKLRSLDGDEAVRRFPRKGLGEERVSRIVIDDGIEPRELCFDVN